MSPQQRKRHNHRRDKHFSRIVEEGKLYSQPASEGSVPLPGSGPLGTRARRVEGGWLINGCKVFASMASVADFHGVLCTEDIEGEEPSMRNKLYIAIPKNAPGLSVIGRWDSIGMRGTDSRGLRMKDVFVSADEQLLPRGMYAKAAGMWPIVFCTMMATYLGIASAAYDFALECVRGDSPRIVLASKAHLPAKQTAIAQMLIRLEGMRAMFWRVSQEIGANPTKEQRQLMHATHYAIAEGSHELVSLAMRTCGGRGLLRDIELERLFRDSRCASVMNPTAESLLGTIGANALVA